MCRWHWSVALALHGTARAAGHHRANAVHTPCPCTCPCPCPYRARYAVPMHMPTHAVPMPCLRRPPPCDAAQVRMAAQRTGWAASAASSAVSGEGLMCFFQGPGRLWLQTHKPRPEPGAKGGESAVACVVCMLFFFGILVLGLMFVAPAALVNGPLGSWAEATGPRGHPAHHGLRHGEL